MSLAIEPRLPRHGGGGDVCPEFERLAGATILRVGTPPDLDLEGGGLAIEYRPAGSSTAEVLIFGFNDLGLWICS